MILIWIIQEIIIWILFMLFWVVFMSIVILANPGLPLVECYFLLILNPHIATILQLPEANSNLIGHSWDQHNHNVMWSLTDF